MVTVYLNTAFQENPNSYFISSPAEMKSGWFKGVKSVGITGATSTPEWLLIQVKNEIESNLVS